MKVIVAGQGGNYNLEDYVSSAFASIGWEVMRVDTYGEMRLSRPFGKYYRIVAARSRAFDDLLVGVGRLETQVESMVRKERPDLLLVIKGELFPASVASKLQKELGIKTALWFPDDPRYVKSLLMKKAPAFELVAVSAKSTVRKLQLSGVSRVIHLPFACDPTIHRAIGLAKTLEVTLVGSYYSERARALSALRRDVKIWGPYWKMPWVSGQIRRQVMSGGSYGKKYIEIMNRSRITINVHHSSDSGVMGKTNMRVYEAAGCGTFQLTDFAPGLEDAFELGNEVVCYSSPEELAELVEFYLEADAKRSLIAKASQLRAYKEHTYVNRVSSLLKSIGFSANEIAHPSSEETTGLPV